MSELREGPLTFRSLQDRAETNPSLLNTRLHELRQAALTTRGERGYQLTEQGQALLGLLTPIAAWSESWRAEVDRIDRDLP